MNDVNDWVARAAALLRSDEVWSEAVAVTPPTHDRAAHVVDVDGQHVIAQFVLWPSGAFEASALTVDDGERFYFNSQPDADAHSLSKAWREFVEAITHAEVRRSGARPS